MFDPREIFWRQSEILENLWSNGRIPTFEALRDQLARFYFTPDFWLILFARLLCLALWLKGLSGGRQDNEPQWTSNVSIASDLTQEFRGSSFKIYHRQLGSFQMVPSAARLNPSTDWLLEASNDAS